MDNPLFVAIVVFVLVLAVALLYQWRHKIKKQPAIGQAAEPVIEPLSQEKLSEAQRDGMLIEQGRFIKIRQADPSFDETKFKDHVTAFYLHFLTSQSQGKITELREQMTEEMFASLKVEEDRQAAEGNAHKNFNISFRSVELLDAWQENGRDFIKVRYLSDFMDSCTEEKDEDQICNVMGEKVDHIKDWIFSRISGANPWYLSAIESV